LGRRAQILTGIAAHVEVSSTSGPAAQSASIFNQRQILATQHRLYY